MLKKGLAQIEPNLFYFSSDDRPLLLLASGFGPGVPKGRGAVEYKAARRGIHRIDTEIAEPLELESAPRFGPSQARFRPARRERLDGFWA